MFKCVCITEDVLNFISLESVTPVGFKRSERQGEVHCEHSVKLWSTVLEKKVLLTTLLENNQILSGLSVMIITIIIHIYIIRIANRIKKDICREI